MNSIRVYLLVFLTSALVIATVVIGLVVYTGTRHEIREMYTTHLQQLGELLGQQQKNVDNCGWSVSDLPDTGTSALESPRQRVDESEFVIQVWSLGGNLLHTSHPPLHLPLQSRQGFIDLSYGARAWQIYRTDNAHCILQIGQPQSARAEATSEITHHILGPALMQLPLLLILMWLAVGRGLKPLERLSTAIRRRSPVALDPVEDTALPREVLPLVNALNDLLARLDLALRAQRQFTADAAHELRSPLTALQLQLELAQRATTDVDRSRALAQLGAGIQRGNRLVQQLLTLARLDPNAPLKPHGAVALDALARSVVAEFAPQALVRNIDLGLERCDPVSVLGDSDGLEILLGNLVDNAIRYTPAGGRIDVSLWRDGDTAVLDVADSGSGIPIAERERVFDRFYRGEGTAVTGTGLGLAIVQTIAERHGGSVLILDNPLGAGVLFRVCMPCQSP